MSNWNGLGSSWQYSRWVKNLARNARIKNPVAPGFIPETFVYRVIAFFICDTTTNPVSGTRPWLAPALYRLSMSGGADYSFDPSIEPLPTIVKAVEVIGRDLKKLPLTDAEKAFFDIVFALTNNRRYGTKPFYGNVGGSTVAIP